MEEGRRRWEKAEEAAAGAAPLVLLHGFDSNCLEYRRLHPLLGEAGLPAYAVDILGWGWSRGEEGGALLRPPDRTVADAGLDLYEEGPDLPRPESEVEVIAEAAIALAARLSSSGPAAPGQAPRRRPSRPRPSCGQKVARRRFGPRQPGLAPSSWPTAGRPRSGRRLKCALWGGS